MIKHPLSRRSVLSSPFSSSTLFARAQSPAESASSRVEPLSVFMDGRPPVIFDGQAAVVIAGVLVAGFSFASGALMAGERGQDIQAE